MPRGRVVRLGKTATVVRVGKMHVDPGVDWPIRGTAMVAVLAVVARYAGDVWWPADTPWRGYTRLVWTGGLLFLIAHVFLGFHFFHAWDHGRAYADTATRTAAVTGWVWGGGI